MDVYIYIYIYMVISFQGMSHVEASTCIMSTPELLWKMTKCANMQTYL